MSKGTSVLKIASLVWLRLQSRSNQPRSGRFNCWRGVSFEIFPFDSVSNLD